MAKPGSITPHKKFEAEVYVLSKEEGGRHTPFFKGYRPQFYFRTTDVTGAVILPKDVEMVMPGDNIGLSVELINSIAMEDGLAVCDSRGRAHRRGGRGHQDFGVGKEHRPIAQLAERRSPKPQVGGSIPSWPAALETAAAAKKQ